MLGLGLGLRLGCQRFAAVGPAYITIPDYATMATFGDSITVGQNATAAEYRWANIVAAALGATLSNQGISGTVLQNSNGSGGSPQTNNGRDRFISALTGANLKEAVFIIYGYNDARYIAAPETHNVASYINDFQEVLNGLLLLGYAREDIYLGSPYYITDVGLANGSPGFAGQTRAGFEEYVSAVETVATEFGVNFCDMYAETNTAAFIADVTAQDDIHPANVGHALIASSWQTRTTAGTTMNSRTAPASVTATGGAAGVITASCAAVSGATSYEFVPVSLYINGSATADADGSGAVLAVADGTYRVKARAVFGDGTKSPWAYAASDVVVSANFAADSFTDTAGVSFTSHTPEVGGSWTGQSGVSNNAAAITDANRVRASQASAIFQNGGTPASADYYVQADFVKFTAVASSSAGLAVRMQSGAHTLYWARYNEGVGWQVYKTIAGTSTQLGSTVASPTLGNSETKTVRLEVSGGTDPVLVLKVDGATIITATDNSGTRITTAGKAGIRSGTSVTNTTGIHIDNFVAAVL